MANVETLERQVLSDPFWLIGVCCLLRRWPMRRPLKDTEVWCHHLRFFSCYISRWSWWWLWCNSSHFPPFSSPRHFPASPSVSVIAPFPLTPPFNLLFQNISSRKPPRGWSRDKQRRGNSFFSGLQLDYLSIEVSSGCKVKDGNHIHSFTFWFHCAWRRADRDWWAY